jgi:L-amino acid N-acyltransferase YncA
MLVRDARPEDAAAMATIYAHYVRTSVATFAAEPPTAQDWADVIAQRRADGLPVLVGDVDGELAGYAQLSQWRPRPAYRFTVENSIYLDPSFHRRGIGALLLERLIVECEARGFRQMIAVIGDSANAGSIGVHTKGGFKMIGTHPSVGLKFGRWLDTVMMQRDLGEGASTVPGK